MTSDKDIRRVHDVRMILSKRIDGDCGSRRWCVVTVEVETTE